MDYYKSKPTVKTNTPSNIDKRETFGDSETRDQENEMMTRREADETQREQQVERETLEKIEEIKSFYQQMLETLRELEDKEGMNYYKSKPTVKTNTPRNIDKRETFGDSETRDQENEMMTRLEADETQRDQQVERETLEKIEEIKSSIQQTLERLRWKLQYKENVPNESCHIEKPKSYFDHLEDGEFSNDRTLIFGHTVTGDQEDEEVNLATRFFQENEMMRRREADRMQREQLVERETLEQSEEIQRLNQQMLETRRRQFQDEE